MSKSLIFQNLFLHTISLGEIIEQKENQSQNWKKYYFFLHGGELKVIFFLYIFILSLKYIY